MSLILPPSSTLGGRRGGFGAKLPYLKVFGAFLAGAVIAGAAVKGPGASTDADGGAKAVQPAAAKAQAAKSERGPQDAKQKPAAKTQVANNEKAAQDGGAKAAQSAAPAAAPQPATAAQADAPQAPAKYAEPVRTVGPKVETAAVAAAPVELEGAKPARAAPQALAADDETVSTPVPNPKVRPVFPTVRAGPVRPQPAREAVREATPARERAAPAREAPVVAATEPDVAPAPRAKRPEIAIRKPSRPARVQTADARADAPAPRERARRVFDRDRSAREDRFRELQARNEAEGFNLVRSRVTPDGRRVTVYRRYEDEEPRRVMAFGEERRPFMPFRFLGIQ